MIQFSESLADAYVRPARNVAMPSMPGRTVKFLQGHAVIKDGRDMVAMLKRGDVKIVLTPYASSWMETWFREAGQVKAEVLMPEPVPTHTPDPLPEPPVPVQQQGWDPPPEDEDEDDGADSPDADPRAI